jgi:hypothetical protein
MTNCLNCLAPVFPWQPVKRYHDRQFKWQRVTSWTMVCPVPSCTMFRMSLAPVQISLRTAFGAVAFAGIACVSLKNAGPLWWSILSTASMLLVMAVAVVAVSGAGRGRAASVGFLVCVAIYGGMLFASGAKELDPYSGLLPTSKSMVFALEAIAQRTYVDVRTGKNVPAPAPGSSTANVAVAETPDRNEMMRIAHLLWGVLLGTAGAAFALFVYGRSKERSQ